MFFLRPLNDPDSNTQKTGDAEQAEGFHRRALRAREVVHGLDHPDVPLLLSNLAGTLYIQVIIFSHQGSDAPAGLCGSCLVDRLRSNAA